MTITSDTRTRDTDRPDESEPVTRSHPVLFGLLGLLIALMLSFGALQVLMLLMPNGTTGA